MVRKMDTFFKIYLMIAPNKIIIPMVKQGNKLFQIKIIYSYRTIKNIVSVTFFTTFKATFQFKMVNVQYYPFD